MAGKVDSDQMEATTKTSTKSRVTLTMFCYQVIHTENTQKTPTDSNACANIYASICCRSVIMKRQKQINRNIEFNNKNFL